MTTTKKYIFNNIDRRTATQKTPAPPKMTSALREEKAMTNGSDENIADVAEKPKSTKKMSSSALLKGWSVLIIEIVFMLYT